MRTETDSMGPVNVEDSCYWGAQTQRSVQNFKIGTERMPRPLIHAFALLKKAAALTNVALGHIPHDHGKAIAKACDHIMAGALDGEFPLVVWQTGSGTQTNMNVNEVIANRANELLGAPLGSKMPLHPNDHINYGQSSNDSFPTAMHIATVLQINQRLIPTLHCFHTALMEKAQAFNSFVKVGRTHLQDATPITLGQEFSAYAAQIHMNIQRIQNCLPHLYMLAQGGTAVGTGINCPKGFPEKFAKEISQLTGHPFVSAPNKFEALSSHDTMVEISGALNVLAASCMKIANDVRWLGSGPRCGLGELRLPENEPGSSIMPGKVNPTQSEAMTMVCCQVMGNHVTVSMAGSQGNFELNVFKPVIIYNVLQSIDLLTCACLSFTENCIQGISVNPRQLQENVDKCLMLVTALNPIIGYDAAAQIAKKALAENISLKQAALDLGVVDTDTFDATVHPSSMLGV
jgi:fumarate hydratase class II